MSPRPLFLAADPAAVVALRASARAAHAVVRLNVVALRAGRLVVMHGPIRRELGVKGRDLHPWLLSRSNTRLASAPAVLLRTALRDFTLPSVSDGTCVSDPTGVGHFPSRRLGWRGWWLYSLVGGPGARPGRHFLSSGDGQCASRIECLREPRELARLPPAFWPGLRRWSPTGAAAGL